MKLRQILIGIVIAAVMGWLLWSMMCPNDQRIKDLKEQNGILKVENENLKIDIELREGTIKRLEAEKDEIMKTGVESLDEKDKQIADKQKEILRLRGQQTQTKDYKEKFELEQQVSAKWQESYNILLNELNEIGRPESVYINGKVFYRWPEGSMVFNLVQNYEARLDAKDLIIADWETIAGNNEKRAINAEGLAVEYQKKAAGLALTLKAVTGGGVIVVVIALVALIG